VIIKESLRGFFLQFKPDNTNFKEIAGGQIIFQQQR
jgi:hypothetical protein